LRRPLRRLRLPPDTRDRHAAVAQLLGGPATVLDVGGTPGVLAAYLRAEVTAANIEPPADVIVDPERLPFADGSFDAAVSIDVLEHLPPGRRAAHIAELRRVSRGRVVVACPVGGKGHAASERDLAAWYRRATGHEHRYLDEHLHHGLPKPDELRALGGELWFQGDYREAAAAFRDDVLARRGNSRALMRALRRRAGCPDPELRAEPGEYANRAFLTWERTPRRPAGER
jgi:hypothetical protein